MKRCVPFTFNDISQECDTEIGCYSLEGKALGARITVPQQLFNRYPYNASVYVLLQQLRSTIFDFGIIAFPNLPINKTNHTVAIRAPHEHAYSNNPFLTDKCQNPHQDTPPYPTAFGLDDNRQFSAIWIMSIEGLRHYQQLQLEQPELSVEDLHKVLVPRTLINQSGLLMNHTPGLLLIDNSDACSLYHAKTCLFEAALQSDENTVDSPMYSFNEIGLLNYIDLIDSQRGTHDRDDEEVEAVKAFMETEALLSE